MEKMNSKGAVAEIPRKVGRARISSPRPRIMIMDRSG